MNLATAGTLLSLLINNRSNIRITKQIHSLLLSGGTLMRSLPLLNNLIRCYSLSDNPHQSIVMYKEVLCSSLPFNSFTYTFLINSCANSVNPMPVGNQLHGLTKKMGLGAHVYVQTALVNLYCAYGDMGSAWLVFDEMPERNVVTWNVIITGYVKVGSLENAWRLFNEMPEKNVVSWTGIIDGFVRMEKYTEAIKLFRKMASCEAIKPSEITLLAILPAISASGDSNHCRSIHGYAEKKGFIVFDVRVANSILDTYARCGSIWSALNLFQDINDELKNLVSWTTIISGLAMHGMGEKAIELFERMENVGLKANEITFLSVMNACSHSGLVDEGLMFFNRMKNDYQVEANIKHYGCVIDMLGRVGRFEEAEEIALGIPRDIVNDVVWRTLLGACSMHGDVEVGERVTKRIMELEKGYGGDYALMYNLFVGIGKFDDAENLRSLMSRRNVYKPCGCSGTTVCV